MTEPATIATAEEIAESLAALGTIDLDMLAYDISNLLDRNDYGMPALTWDNLRAGLRPFLLTAIATAQAAADAHAGVSRNADGTLRHTCNGDNLSGLPFGRKAPHGECARCDELADGAAPRARFGGRKTTAERDAERATELAAHFASDKHRSGGCGIVCTFGDW